MKKKRFSVQQMVGVLKQAEVGVPIGEWVRQVGISEQTFYRWRKEYGGLKREPANRLLSLRPPPWPQQSAGVPFRQAILPPCPLHRTTSPLRAQKFPGATSCKTCFSSDNSATSRFNRGFSFSNSFSRFA